MISANEFLPTALASLMEEAIAAHSAGDLTAAECGYRAVLATEPNHAFALGGLGALLGQSGRADVATEYLARACALAPSDPVLHHNYGEALRQLGRFPAAEAALRRTLELDPHFIPAYESLIAVLALHHAQALATRDTKGAVILAGELARLANNQGNAFLERHDILRAVACYRFALTQRADYVMAWSNLGNGLRDLGQVSEAESACRQAIALDPGFGPAWNNLGNALVEQLRLEEAAQCYEKALRHCPTLNGAKHNLDSGHLFNLLFAPDLSAADIARRHRTWGASFPAPVGRTWKNSRDLSRRLRVGYLSADFREHAMRHFIEPLLEHHDPREVEVVCYAQNPVADAHTERMMRHASIWRWVHAMSDLELGERIERDEIDILVDCSGHTQGNRLAALAGKPAPIMISWLGYLCTTGLPSMDYRLTDEWVDPPGLTEPLHTETLLRVRGGMMAYRPHERCPEVREPPSNARGVVTFGSLNNVQKLNAVLVRLWAEILNAVPGSGLLLQSKLLADPAMVGRIRGMFEAHGVRPDRLDLRPANSEFLATYHDIDIALDTSPYGGGVTTCDGIWMGVPVITLPCDRPSGRLTSSILHQVGHAEWIADTDRNYVCKAVDMALATDSLRRIRSQLRDQVARSTLCDDAGFARRVERVYRGIWTRWLSESAFACAGVGAV